MARSAVVRLVVLPLVVVLALTAAITACQPGVRRHVHAWLSHDVGAPEFTWPVDGFESGEAPRVRLAFAGDVGTGSDHAWRTAAAAAALEEEREFDAVVLLGDNPRLLPRRSGGLWSPARGLWRPACGLRTRP